MHYEGEVQVCLHCCECGWSDERTPTQVWSVDCEPMEDVRLKIEMQYRHQLESLAAYYHMLTGECDHPLYGVTFDWESLKLHRVR